MSAQRVPDDAIVDRAAQTDQLALELATTRAVIEADHWPLSAEDGSGLMPLPSLVSTIVGALRHAERERDRWRAAYVARATDGVGAAHAAAVEHIHKVERALIHALRVAAPVTDTEVAPPLAEAWQLVDPTGAIRRHERAVQRPAARASGIDPQRKGLGATQREVMARIDAGWTAHVGTWPRIRGVRGYRMVRSGELRRGGQVWPVALDVLESLARRGLLTLIEEPVASGGGS